VILNSGVSENFKKLKVLRILGDLKFSETPEFKNSQKLQNFIIYNYKL